MASTCVEYTHDDWPIESDRRPLGWREFAGFDRNPYLVTFQVGPENSFLFVNVHLFFGGDTKKDMDRRALETFAVARWAKQRRDSRFSFCREIIALGDFNMPKRASTDPIFRGLTSRGLELPDHTSEVGSNLASDKHYDQIAFFPGVFAHDAGFERTADFADGDLQWPASSHGELG